MGRLAKGSLLGLPVLALLVVQFLLFWRQDIIHFILELCAHLLTSLTIGSSVEVIFCGERIQLSLLVLCQLNAQFVELASDASNRIDSFFRTCFCSRSFHGGSGLLVTTCGFLGF